MLAAPVRRVEVRRRRWIGTAEGSVVPHHRPQPASPRLAAGQYRHRRVVGVQPFSRANVSLDGLGQRPQRRVTAPTQSARVETSIGTPSRLKALALPVQRQVQSELAEHHLGQQVRTGSPAGDRMERRRRLGDRLAAPAGHLLAHVLESRTSSPEPAPESR